jgi:hypothetical protein
MSVSRRRRRTGRHWQANRAAESTGPTALAVRSVSDGHNAPMVGGFVASFVVMPPPRSETLFIGLYKVLALGKCEAGGRDLDHQAGRCGDALLTVSSIFGWPYRQNYQNRSAGQAACSPCQPYRGPCAGWPRGRAEVAPRHVRPRPGAGLQADGYLAARLGKKRCCTPGPCGTNRRSMLTLVWLEVFSTVPCDSRPPSNSSIWPYPTGTGV